MKIKYSGIELEVVHLQDFKRTPVMSDDGVDYLFTKFEILATGVVSSDQVRKSLFDGSINDGSAIGMSYNKDGGFSLRADAAPAAFFDPAARAGVDARRLVAPPSVAKTVNSNPIITDKTIRHWLEIPRRRLVVENHNPNDHQILLQSPKHGHLVDAHNGPKPTVYDIQESLGDARVFLVMFGVETYVNECEENTDSFGPFLSNRYGQTQDIDADGFITITTEGEAYFRTDLVYSNRLNPDNLRAYLFLPIPNGFKRDAIQVHGDSDVSRIRYTFVDRQVQHQLVVGDDVGATRVEATYRQFVLQSDDALGTALQGVERHYNIAVNSKWAQPELPEKTPKKKKRPAKRKPTMDDL